MEDRGRQLTLGVYGAVVTERGGDWWTFASFGRIIDLLAARVGRVRYHAPRASEASAEACGHRISAENVEVSAGPVWRNSAAALRRPDRLVADYWRLARSCDAILLRGSAPLLWTAHLFGRLRRRPVVHWVVGNPAAVLAAQRRGYGTRVERCGVAFAAFEQRLTRWSARVCGSTILANGAELARLYRGPRTAEVVSTSIVASDFRERPDTCGGDSIRILFVGFFRPEKGLEYLIRALPQVASPKPVRLDIVGTAGAFPGERARLERIAAECWVADRLRWAGHAAFGPELFSWIDAADMLVLPSLSEGTPRVLVEARARSVPVVATRVGGVPSSVADGEDGLLIPPRDPAALAQACSRLIADGELRRRLIERGRERVREWTVDRFVDRLMVHLETRN